MSFTVQDLSADTMAWASRSKDGEDNFMPVGAAGTSVLEGESRMNMHSKLGQPRYLSIMTNTKPSPAVIEMAAALFLVSFTASAQSICPEDSLALSVTVTTDAWGYELYWELIDASAECGDGSALVWGGNPEVGCGEGVPGLPGEVYPNNQVIVAPTVCVSEEDSLVLVHRDSYGDGGSQFSIALSGNEAFAYGGTGGGNDWAFQPVVISGDLPCLAETIYADSASWVGSTSDATVSPNEPAPPGLGCGTFGGWCESGLSNTVWLSWPVPADGGVFEITTCNVETTFDTQLALWRADDCADFSTFELLNANDDNGCGLGAYRSTLLTPCLEGGEELLLQIDGYYGETGTLEVSIVSTSLGGFERRRSKHLCNLESSFNPDGAIYPNTNVGANSVIAGQVLGFTSNDAAIGLCCRALCVDGRILWPTSRRNTSSRSQHHRRVQTLMAICKKPPAGRGRSCWWPRRGLRHMDDRHL